MRGTIVVLMGVENLAAITAALLRGGRSGDTAACAVQEGSLQGEREVVGTLGTIADRVRQHDIQAPAVIVIGAVVATARGTQSEHGVARELATASPRHYTSTRSKAPTR
jgi:uroporphyrin-III C-methyltransferase/precorrin-2 dehydrogenase/sirohydrochlorin ferrochelatase